MKNMESSSGESNVGSEDPTPKVRIPGEIVKFKQLDANGLPPNSSEARKLTSQIVNSFIRFRLIPGVGIRT